MAWVSEDWDKLGSFLSSGLGAYGSERQRRQENRWRQEKMDLESQRAEAYIATLNEQMESSQQRRTADARAAERLRTPSGEAWGGGPEDVPLGELGGYQAHQQFLESGEETARERAEVSEAIREHFPEGLPAGLTYADFQELKPFLQDERRAARKAELERLKADKDDDEGGISAAMAAQIRLIEERSRVQALMGFALQKPDLMNVVAEARDDLTGKLNWSRIARALGEEGWQRLQESAQYRTDEWLIGKGILTPGMQQRYEQRHYKSLGGVESPDEEEDRRETTTPTRKGTVKTEEGGERPFTTEERKAYYLEEHPGLQQPAMAGLLADPQAVDVLALKELYSDKPASGFSALETQDWKTLDPSRQWAGWSGEIQEAKATQAQTARRKEFERFRGRPRQRNVPRR